MWDYEVSGKQVLRQWFSYRKANRERPIIGDRRPPSKLGEIQPDHWLAEYTTELLNVLHVLGLLVGLEPSQATLLEADLLRPNDLRRGAARRTRSLRPQARPARPGRRLYQSIRPCSTNRRRQEAPQAAPVEPFPPAPASR